MLYSLWNILYVLRQAYFLFDYISDSAENKNKNMMTKPSTSQYCLENEQKKKEISVKLSSDRYVWKNETWKNLSGIDRREIDELMKLMTNMRTTNVSRGFFNQEVGPSSLIDSFFCFKQACRLTEIHFSWTLRSDPN